MIRPETAADYATVRQVNELAFGRPDEAALVDTLRSAHPYVSLVAVKSEQTVGHIFFSPVFLEGAFILALGLAPIAVLPEYQNQGIGSRLVQAGLEQCQRLGCEVVVVLGRPEYYSRFGFVSARQKGLRCEYPVLDEFMVLELRPGALAGRQGLVKYQPEFGNL